MTQGHMPQMHTRAEYDALMDEDLATLAHERGFQRNLEFHVQREDERFVAHFSSYATPRALRGPTGSMLLAGTGSTRRAAIIMLLRIDELARIVVAR